MNKEIRSLENAEIRSLGDDSRLIEGYALLFNTDSVDLGGFIETIDRNALEGVLEKSDILCLYNHLEHQVLARSTNLSGTLSLNIDDLGLRYSFKAPKTHLGDEVLDAVNRGDLRNSSFCFSVLPSNIKIERSGDKLYRKIMKFENLFDVSPVFRPAYENTSVAKRSIEQFIELEAVEDNNNVEVEKSYEVENLTDYFKQLENDIDAFKKNK